MENSQTLQMMEGKSSHSTTPGSALTKQKLEKLQGDSDHERGVLGTRFRGSLKRLGDAGLVAVTKTKTAHLGPMGKDKTETGCLFEEEKDMKTDYYIKQLVHLGSADYLSHLCTDQDSLKPHNKSVVLTLSHPSGLLN